MQIHSERRTGADRRQFNPSSEAILGSWNEFHFGAATHDGDHGTYDPYDPYWEPVKGQDDD